MTIKLPPLPYALDALEPHISKRTLEFHYGKHHAGYVNKLNALIKDGEFETASLEEIVLNASGAIFNNAAQVWNHTFYWHSMTAKQHGQPKDELAEAIIESFGSMDAFKEKFLNAANSHFGSGWAWLVKEDDGSLSVYSTANAMTPLAEGKTALLTCDVWEHAYYLDVQNDRPKYVNNFWALANWDFALENYLAD